MNYTVYKHTNLKNGKIYVDQVIKQLLNTNDAATSMQVKNEITKEYIDYLLSIDEQYVASVTVTSELSSNFTTFSKSSSDNISKVFSFKLSVKNFISKFAKVFLSKNFSSDGL